MNRIHPTAVLEGDVVLGDGNVIGPFCHLQGPLALGDDNTIASHVCLGLKGQDTRDRHYDDTDKRVVIGSRNVIREFTSIQTGCYEDATVVGDDVFVMQSVHVPHDAHLGDGVVLTPMVALAGLVRVLEGAHLALGSTVVQYTVVGPYSIVAANASVRRHVRPFTRYIPGKPDTVNTHAVCRYGFSEWADQVEAYVFDGVHPQQPRLAGIVSAYEAAVRDRDDRRASAR